MFSGLTQSAGSALGGSRFSLVSVLPTVVLGGYVTVLVESGAYSGHRASFSHVVRLVETNPVWAGVIAFGLLLGAILLRPFQVVLVQILEGYWSARGPVGFAAQLATERHERRFEKARVMQSARPLTKRGKTLTMQARHARAQRKAEAISLRARSIYDSYPRPDSDDVLHNSRLMPTRLGNLLRDGEDVAGNRYGLDLPAVEHRLQPVLSAPVRDLITRQLDLLDTLSALCVMFSAAAVASAVLIIRWDAASLAPCVAVLAAVASYRGALRVADEHRVVLATAVDLHRFDMIKALHYELPKTAKQEYRFNLRLSGFLGDGRSLASDQMQRHQYEHPAPAAGDGATRPIPPN